MQFLRWVAVALTMLPGLAFAVYPERPITMIVAFVPGGGSDTLARAMVPYLEKQLGGGAKIIVVNRPGAGGEIGHATLAAAAPDGYTVGIINSAAFLPMAIEKGAPILWPRLDLIGNVVDDPYSLVVHVETPFKSLKQLVTFAKSNPGAVNVGIPGSGITAKLFEHVAGVKLNIIPYKGGGDVRIALAGRQIVVATYAISEALQAIRGGAPLRMLAQFSKARSTLAPDVPTAHEQGVEFETASLRGLAAPKGLPVDARERLVKAVAKVVADPEFQQRSMQLYTPLRYLSPAEFETALRDGDAQLRQLWKQSPWIQN